MIAQNPAVRRAVRRRGGQAGCEPPRLEPEHAVAASRARAALWVATTTVSPRARASSLTSAEQPLPGRGVEVAGGLVGQQQPRLARRGRGPPPPAAARRPTACPGGGVARSASPTSVEQPRGAALRLGQRPPRDEQRHRHVLERRELGQQVVELEHEAERAVAERAALGLRRARARPRRRSAACPASARSSVPSTCSSVDLPTPEAPTIASRSPAATSRSVPCSTLTSAAGVL